MRVCNALGVSNDDKVRMWLVFSSSRRPHTVLADMQATLEGVGLTPPGFMSVPR